LNIPPALAQRLRDCYPQAEAWLARWPQQLQACLDTWQLEALGWVENLSYHPVLWVCQSDGRRAILKLLPPGPEARAEHCALQHYAGQGAVRLLAWDVTQSALLLEACLPGQSLHQLQHEEQEVTQAARVMLQLWQSTARAAAPPELIPLRQWTQGLERLLQQPAQPLPAALLQRAKAEREALLGSSPAVLLHGDLHHGNILSQGFQPEQRFVAIDPKGLWGDAAYEVGAYLTNPRDRLQACKSLPQLLQRRVAIFSECLKIEAEILSRWGFVQAVLSACWSYEDHGEVDAFALHLADCFD